MKLYRSLLLLVVLMLASAFSFAEEPPYLPSRERLEKLLHEYFGEPEDEKSTKPLSLHELKDKEISDKLFEINYQLGKLLDANVPLGDLSWVGIRQTSNSTLSIDVIAHPRWDGITTILDFLIYSNEASSNDLKVSLLDIGLNEVETSKLLSMNGKNTQQSFRKKVEDKNNPIRRHYGMKIREIVKNGENPQEEVFELLYRISKNIWDLRYEEALNVFNLLPIESQVKLNSYWHQGKKSRNMTKVGDSIKEQIDSTVAIILSDQFESVFLK